jgi:hypothetical protein
MAIDRERTAALLNAFAELRRTWDELVGLQPDIVAASRPLTGGDLATLGHAFSAHQNAAPALSREIMALHLGDLVTARKGRV